VERSENHEEKGRHMAGRYLTLLCFALVGRPERLEPNSGMAAQHQPALTAIGGCCDVNVAARVALTREDGERCARTIELRDRQCSNTAQQQPHRRIATEYEVVAIGPMRGMPTSRGLLRHRRRARPSRSQWRPSMQRWRLR
jgi:hypothetical protein